MSFSWTWDVPDGHGAAVLGYKVNFKDYTKDQETYEDIIRKKTNHKFYVTSDKEQNSMVIENVFTAKDLEPNKVYSLQVTTLPNLRRQIDIPSLVATSPQFS